MHVLILVEGDTELEFIDRLSREFFPRRPKTVRNLRGNYNVNNKIIDRILGFIELHPKKQFSVCVCVDQERPGSPPINCEMIQAELGKRGHAPQIIPIVALLMTESQFFADIDSIYSFLRAPKAQRNTKKYSQFRKLTHADLSQLFRRHGKQYTKGHRVEHFVASLDLNKIVSACEELRLLVDHCK